MKRLLMIAMLALCMMPACAKKKVKVQLFPDGTPIPEWFSNAAKVDVETLGKKYVG